MRYELAVLLPLLFLPLAQPEAQGSELSQDQIGALMREAEKSADFMNLVARAKVLGFKEVRYLGFEIESDRILGVALSRGKDSALLIFRVFEDGYSEAYLYLIKGDRVLLDSMSRSGVVTMFGNGGCRTCGLRVEPLEAGCTDCYSNGCRPCCSKQISCPSGRYADCKYICSSWNYGCLYLCGLTIVGCATSCADCIAGSRIACGLCIACVLGSPYVGEACGECRTRSYCACRCIRYH